MFAYPTLSRRQGALAVEIELRWFRTSGLFDPTPIAPQAGAPGVDGLLSFLEVTL